MTLVSPEESGNTSVKSLDDRRVHELPESGLGWAFGPRNPKTSAFVIVAIVGLSFVTEISSFATFAGLITAGVAVAMQSVLVSIVGYFFLIGKYGIRVGDRVQIGNVIGEVMISSPAASPSAA